MQKECQQSDGNNGAQQNWGQKSSFPWGNSQAPCVMCVWSFCVSTHQEDQSIGIGKERHLFLYNTKGVCAIFVQLFCCSIPKDLCHIRSQLQGASILTQLKNSCSFRCLICWQTATLLRLLQELLVGGEQLPFLESLDGNERTMCLHFWKARHHTLCVSNVKILYLEGNWLPFLCHFIAFHVIIGKVCALPPAFFEKNATSIKTSRAELEEEKQSLVYSCLKVHLGTNQAI